MQNNSSLIEIIRQQKMLLLFYHDEEEVCLGIANAVYNAGIKVIEFTNRGKMAFQNFKALVAARNETIPDLVLAIGTITTAAQADMFISAGANFLISPVFDDTVCETAKQHNKLLDTRL
jgi:2-dehydro-3-deoxyphosphogluconate aldolase / (4S)-4-hydroxy-2-oxoglutarate aldolase